MDRKCETLILLPVQTLCHGYLFVVIILWFHAPSSGRMQLDRQEQSATSARQRFVAELDQERQRSQLEQQTIQKTTAIELDQLKLQHAQQLQQQQALLVEAVAEQQRRGEVAVQVSLLPIVWCNYGHY